MNLYIRPTESVSGAVELPASKSYSIRAFLVAACGGQSKIVHPSSCKDALVALKVAKVLGARIRSSKDSFEISSQGIRPGSQLIQVQESGTVLRMVTPLLCLQERSLTITGEGSLLKRPNWFMVETLRNYGVDIQGEGDDHRIPLVIKGGKFQARIIKTDATVSSQFISALLMACPLMINDSRLVLTGKSVVSSDYVVMTEQILSKAGIKIRRKSSREFLIQGAQKYKGLKRFVVPSDYGLAAFLMGAALIVKSNVHLKGELNKHFVQSDEHIMEFLKRMGAQLKQTSKEIHIRGPQKLKGGIFSLKNCPDLVPVMSVLALFAQGRTKIVDIAHARVKESDRISDLRQELLKLGAKIEETKDSLTITPQSQYNPNVVLNAHNDHRLAMAFSLVGIKVGATIQGMQAVEKSYPEFVRHLKILGVGTKIVKE